MNPVKIAAMALVIFGVLIAGGVFFLELIRHLGSH